MNKYINQYNRKQQVKLRKMERSSPKEYWKLINNFNKAKEQNKPSLESFLDFFENLNMPESNDVELYYGESFANLIDPNDYDQILNRPITEDEIGKCINKLKI